MAMFSNGNRKVRSRRPRTAQAMGKTGLSPDLSKTRQLQRRAIEVNKQIHRLECIIADAPRLQKQRRLATLDELPPLDPGVSRSRCRKLSLAQKSKMTTRRLGLLLELLLVLSGIAAVIGWLNHWFHFLPR